MSCCSRDRLGANVAYAYDWNGLGAAATKKYEWSVWCSKTSVFGGEATSKEEAQAQAVLAAGTECTGHDLPVAYVAVREIDVASGAVLRVVWKQGSPQDYVPIDWRSFFNTSKAKAAGWAVVSALGIMTVVGGVALAKHWSK